MHSDQFELKSYLKLNTKYVFSEGEQFPLTEKKNFKTVSRKKIETNRDQAAEHSRQDHRSIVPTPTTDKTRTGGASIEVNTQTTSAVTERLRMTGHDTTAINEH